MPGRRERAATFRRGSFDLCILDVMMPKMDGFTLARQLRSENATVPFLFLTARSLKDDKLKGFNLGAEDYVTKPFDETELLCRIRVILRRQADALQSPTPPHLHEHHPVKYVEFRKPLLLLKTTLPKGKSKLLLPQTPFKLPK